MGGPRNKTYKRSWRNLLLNKQYQLSFTLLMVGLAALLMAGLGWWVNGEERPEVARCIDVDLNFSPSTNLLPIRRLDLAIGESAEVKAAWLRFPSFALEPLDQVYRRISADAYRYESAGGSFVRDLQVNAAGFVTDYPDFWTAEAAT